MRIQLSDHFDYKKLLKLTLPSIVMLVVTNLYAVVDGFFVSNYAGKTPFSAVNFIMPVLLIVGSIGFMMGTGGGALIAKTMGERDSRKANEIFFYGGLSVCNHGRGLGGRWGNCFAASSVCPGRRRRAT